MILYFSGTGNSRYAAQLLSGETEDRAEDINHFIKEGKYPTFFSDVPYVIVTPVYAWRIPRVVEDFIRRCSFEGRKEAYFVITCGDSIGDAARYACRLCQEVGFLYRGTADIVMPENYITLFQAPSSEECIRLLRKAEKRIREIGQIICQSGELKPEGKPSWLLSSVVNPLFYTFYVTSKGFYAEDLCNGCGLCQKVCPCNVIILVDGKPQWQEGCTQCMACISSCPVQAIEYRKKTQGKVRYRCENYIETEFDKR